MKDLKAVLWDTTIESENLIEQLKNEMESNPSKAVELQNQIKELELGITNLKKVSFDLETVLDDQHAKLVAFKNMMTEKATNTIENKGILEKQNSFLETFTPEEKQEIIDISNTLTPEERQKIFDTLSNRKVLEEIFIEKGVYDIFKKKKEDRTLEETDKLVKTLDEIFKEIARAKIVYSSTSVEDIIQALYDVDDKMILREEPRKEVLSAAQLEAFKARVSSLPAVIAKRKKEEEVTYEPEAAPEDMKEVMENKEDYNITLEPLGNMNEDEELVDEDAITAAIDEDLEKEFDPWIQKMDKKDEAVVEVPAVEASKEAAVEVPTVEAPKEAAVEVPTVEAPKEAAVEVPTVEAPKEAAVEVPAVEAPKEAAVEVPTVEAPKEAAVEVPTVEAPKEAAVEVPTVEAPKEAAVEVPTVEAPKEAAVEVPTVEAPKEAAVEVPTVEAPKEVAVEVPTVEAPKEAAVEVPAVEAPKEATVEVPTVEASVAEENQINYVKQSVTEDRGIILSTSQAEKTRASFDNQNVLHSEVTREKNTSAAEEKAPVAEATPTVVEQPTVSETPVVSDTQELERMTQEYTEALTKGDEQRANELSNAISEKSKSLQKTAN
ncbi:MAG: hypothetical protein IJG97_04915 [Bacilli bacterium]|nr:hypothetical protein [Bacilli bacterium]